MLTFSSIYGYSCEVFQNYFERLNHLHNIRNNNLSLKLPKVRTEFGRKGFYFLGAKAFNDFPLSVRMLCNQSGLLTTDLTSTSLQECHTDCADTDNGAILFINCYTFSLI